MATRTVMIGTPAGDGKLTVDYVAALLKSRTLLERQDIALDPFFVVNDSLVMQARNTVVAAFLASAATDLVFIDSDIGWRPEDLGRLLSHDVPLVAATYRRKADEVSFTIQFEDGTARRDRASGLLSVRRVGAGFLRLRRDCLERMVAAYPQLRFQPPPVSGDPNPRAALFDTSLSADEFVGEDYTFCDRWRAIGGVVWVDPEIRLRHVGGGGYSGVLWDILAPGQTPP